MSETRKIAEIKIGKRIRKTFNIDSLAKSIEERGLLQPVGIRPDNTLVCGERRIRAVKKLGWDEIPVHVCNNLEDELAFLEAERDENTERENLTPSEAHELAKKLEPKYAKVAAAAQKTGKSTDAKAGGRGKKKNLTANNSKVKRAKTAKEKAATSTGRSASDIRKIDEIKQAAKTDPVFKPFAEELAKKDCKVDGVFKKFKAKQKAIADAAAAQMAAKELESAPQDQHGIIEGDFRIAGSVVADSSVALIFTDPPYDRKSLPMFADLAKFAKRVLVDGGSLITFCGQYVLPEVMAALGTDLKFFWICCCQHTGGTAQMREYGIRVKWKPMLWYVKGDFRRDRETWLDDLVVSQEEKTHHEWQQSVIEARYFIERLTRKGEFVIDPFCGGGTTAYAAKEAGRRWLSFDINPVSVVNARERISGDDENI